MTRVVHVAIDHMPHDVRVFLKQARTLSAAGFDVHTITTNPPPAQSAGVTIHAIHDGRDARRHGLVARLQHRVLRLWRAYRVAIALRADVYHLHEPLLIPLGVLFRARGRRVVYDAHEDYRKVAKQAATGPARLFRWLAYTALEGIANRYFDAVVSATPSIAERFTNRRSAIICNYPLLEESATATVGASAPSARPFVYVGGLTRIRGIRQMLDGLLRARASEPAWLTIAGTCSDRSLEQELHAHPVWSSVTHLGWADRVDVVRLMRESRAGLLLYLPVPNHTEALPNKLFEYMGAGLPVIASDFPVWRSIIEEANCGILVDPESTEEIAAAMVWLMLHPTEAAAMGRRGEAAVLGIYNWESEGRRLVDLYNSMVTSTTSSV